MARKGFWNSFNEGWKAVDPAVSRLNNYWDEKAVADAYTKGATPEERSQFGEADDSQMQGALRETDAMNAQTAAEFQLSPEEQSMYAAQAPTGRVVTGKQYGLGGKWQDQEFSAQDRRAAGYQGVADYYRTSGKLGKALEFEDRMDAQKLRGLQMQGAQNELDMHPDKKKLSSIQLGDAERKQKLAVIEDGFYTAASKGKAGLFEFYKNMMPDGWDDLEERPVQGGGFELVQKRVGADGKPEYGSVMGKFKSEADMYRQAMTKAPSLIGKALELQMNAEKQDESVRHNKAVEGIYAQRAANAGSGGASGWAHKTIQWKDEDGTVRSGMVAVQTKGAQVVAHDPRTGKPLGEDDPRYVALMNAEVPKQPKQYEVKNLGDTTHKLDARGNPVATFSPEAAQWLPPGLSAASYAAKKAEAVESGVDFAVGENEDGLPESAYIAPDGSQHSTLAAAKAVAKAQKSIERKGLYGRDSESARLGNYPPPVRSVIPPVNGGLNDQRRWGGPSATGTFLGKNL
jgi:hypothetical protein